MSKLEHVLSTAEPETVYGLLEQDGAVVVENILSEDHLEKLNSELDALVCSTDPGLRHPAHERMVEFHGCSASAACVRRAFCEFLERLEAGLGGRI